MISLFRILKLEYSNYLILFKSGSFYIAFDEDSTILNKLFNYKIVELNNNIKVGFPLHKINEITSKLELLNINYLIIDNKNSVKKYENDNNKFKDYTESVYKYININNRINNICTKLKGIKDSNKLEEILDQIESIIH